MVTDLLLLRKHLINIAESALKYVTEKQTITAYNSLDESIYCRVILLNRKRSGELQRMLLETYQSSSKRPENEEYNTAVSSSEQILLRNLKRIVIKGKRGKGVPVLFSKDDLTEKLKWLVGTEYVDLDPGMPIYRSENPTLHRQQEYNLLISHHQWQCFSKRYRRRRSCIYKFSV